MQLINEHGIEVNLTEEVWSRTVHDRPFEARKYRRADVGVQAAGPSDRMLLLLFENGIGDVIHSMPAIRAKMDSGTHVAIGCNPDHAQIYRRLGCEIIEERDPTVGIIKKYYSDFGQIHSLQHWCRAHDEEAGGEVTVNRFDQFANYIKSGLPESFDFRQYLIGHIDTKAAVTDLVLGLDSTSPHRTYPHHQQLYDELVARHFTVRAMGLPGAGAEYTENLTLDGLLMAVDSAKTVVAVDSGVLAIAMALGKPVVAIMGPTSDHIIIGQFAKYRTIENDVVVLRSGLSDNRCVRPCNFSNRRGFKVNGKCQNHADCMREITLPTILTTLEQLWQKYPNSKPLNKREKPTVVAAANSTRRKSSTRKRSTAKGSPRKRDDSKNKLPTNLELTVLSPLPTAEDVSI